AGQRVAIGVKAARRQPHQRVAGPDRLAVRARLDQTDYETSEVVIPQRVDTGHLRGLAAEQRTARSTACGGHAFDELREDIRVQPPRREVVRKNSGRARAVAMSLTQWLTMSMPMPRCDPAAIATLIFVPTPSALAARWPPPGSAYKPANGPTPETTSLPCVAAISGLTLSSARSYASMSTPAAAYDSPSLLTSQILASCGEGGPGTLPRRARGPQWLPRTASCPSRAAAAPAPGRNRQSRRGRTPERCR